jgi:tetratricopeptide (TPR) repeat protein
VSPEASGSHCEPAGCSRRLLPGGLAALCVLLARLAAAAGAPDPGQLLSSADHVKTVNFSEFVRILQSIQQHPENLTPPQRVFLRYLEGWKNAYDGDDDTAIARLSALADEPVDVTIRLRAGATAVNVLALSKRYEEAFSRLSRVLALLPQVADKAARQQALLDAADLYTQVGQFGLALTYSQTIIEEDWDGRGVCKGGRTAKRHRRLREGGRARQCGFPPDHRSEGLHRFGQAR